MSRPFVVQTELMGSAEFALPSGTVTFLLTDVEGSTQLWESRSEDMRAAIVSHYEILDEAIEAAGGVRPVEQGEGDSVVAAFSRAADAVRAAVDAERRLQDELPWLLVRMAIHTGEAEFRDDGNYIGRTITRCARLRACGHGAQVLLSESSSVLVRDVLPPGVDLVSLGSARLRDLSRPEQVFQLVHPDLRATFPPLRSLDSAPHNLPIPLTSFVGREREQQAVIELITHERLVTLTGSGGAGKTRLALEAAAVTADRHRDGLWWVELAPVALPAEVAVVVAVAARQPVAPGIDPLDQLVHEWRGGAKVLVVLDNAEHVVDAVASAVQRLLAACPHLHVLVTSREPLGVTGEVIWRVPSLSTPEPETLHTVSMATLNTFDAVLLFVDRARSARPNLVVDDSTAPHIAAICARLDGIPLAIELAAARARSMPLAQLSSGLNDAFRLLTGGARTVLPRQQTLLASIAWSVDALDDAEQAVFRRVAVFQSRFSLSAAEAVAADGELVASIDVLDLVARLVDKSLVLLDDVSGRYVMLETVRQFGRDRLRDAGELATTRQRHAAWFAQWCGEVGRGLHGVSNEDVAADMPDAVAALEWSYDTDLATAARICSGLGWFRGAVGSHASLSRQCDWLINFNRSADAADWAIAVAGTGLAAAFAGRMDFLPLLADAHAAIDAGDRYHRRLLEFPAAAERQRQGDGTDMSRIVEEALDDSDDLCFLTAAGQSSFTSLRSGHFTEVRRLLDQARLILDRRGAELTADVSGPMVTASFEFAMLSGRFDDADTLMARSHPIRSNMAFPLAASNAYLAVLTEDRVRLARSIAIIDREVPPVFAGLVHYIRCFSAWLDERWADAADAGVNGWAGMRPNGVTQGVFGSLVTCSLLAAGRLDHAQALADEWAVVVEQYGDRPLHRATLHYNRSLINMTVGLEADALGDAHVVLDLAFRHGFQLMIIDALELIAELTSERGNPVLATRLVGAADAERQRIAYLARLRPQPHIARAKQLELAANDPATVGEGRPLTIDQAVELAQRARGQRSRPLHGWESLTPTERTVVDLVAAGLPNAEIAQQLFMSTATVKTHLTHIFTKLKIRNRTELAATALDDDHRPRRDRS